MFRVIGLANAVIDMSFGGVTFPVVPSKHQDLSGRLISAGGMANTLFCGARLGLQMVAMGNIGNDEMSNLWRSQLTAEQIDVSNMIVHAAQPTTIALVLADDNGEHVFLGTRGDYSQANNGTFPAQWHLTITQADAILLYGWSYVMQGADDNLGALAAAREANVPVFFDPGPVIPQLPREWLLAMLAGADVVLLTLDEAQMVLGDEVVGVGDYGEAPFVDTAEKIGQLGPKLVILKLGANGILAHSVNETIHQPGLPVEVADLTGAGDSVAAAVMYAYLHKLPLANLLSLANATGAACVQKFGAGVNVPYKSEIIAMLKKSGAEFMLD